MPQAERRARLEAAFGRRRGAHPPHAGDPRPRARRRLVRPVRGRRPRRRDREAARRALPARQAGDAQDQAPADGRLRRRRLPLAQERAGDARRVAAPRPVRRRRQAPPRRRSRRRSRGRSGRRSSRSSRRSARTRLDGHPWQEWAEWASLGAADASGQRMPGATSRWNRGKDLSWEPLRAERVVEVAYDHLQGDRFRHGTTFCAGARQAARRLPLRPARGDAPPTRSRRSSAPRPSASPAAFSLGRLLLARRTLELSGPVRPLVAGPRIVVGIEGFLSRAIRLRDVDQVHPDARPERRRAAHSNT